MKRSITFTIALLCIVTFAFSQEKYTMYETIYLKPKADTKKELTKNMQEHNKKFHPEGAYDSHVWAVFTGCHAGEMLWAMGPCTFSDLDNRPDSKDHNEDWEQNVAPLIEDMSEVEYWRLDDKLSYSPEGSTPGSKVLWTMYDIKPFQEYRFKELVEKVVTVYREKELDRNFNVYWNQFDTGKGRDVCIERFFDKWAYFDQDRKFISQYEEVHGEGSWNKAMREYEDVVVSSQDELAEFLKDMSGE